MNKLTFEAEQWLGAGVEEKAKILDYYNKNCVSLVKPSRRYKMKMTDNWCAAFVSAMAHKVGYVAGQFPFEVSVHEQMVLAKQWKVWGGWLDDIKEGDLIVFDWLGNGWCDHVGIVKAVFDDSIVTIEGNYSGTVKSRSVKRNSRQVAGFIMLRQGFYTPTIEGAIQAKVRQVLRGELGNGEVRKIALGSDYKEVQRLVNRILEE